MTLQWFINIPNKDQHSFIAFDLVNFYPSISRKLLNDALSFTASYTDISAEDRKIIFHTKQLLLFNDNTPWNKKHSTAPFDVTMGSFDGAETCELVGSYLFNRLPEGIRKQIVLYRDRADSLGAFQHTPKEIEGIKKDICKVSRNNGLKITIEANKKIVNFVDVTLNLDKRSYEPYTKPNNTPLYVHHESNHPHSILKSIPLAINKRLSEISSNKEAFDKPAPIYQQALEKSGYKHQLKFDQTRSEERSRRRNITWYNPPFSKNVATNVGKKFLPIVKESFSPGHPLRKIFNRNTLKVSYSCMPNLERKISAHNKSSLVNNSQSHEKSCNCRVKHSCPLSCDCLTQNVVYQATVESTMGKETYIELPRINSKQDSETTRLHLEMTTKGTQST